MKKDVRELVIEEMSSFMASRRVPRTIYMDNNTFIELLREVSPHYTYDDSVPFIFGMKIVIEAPKCYCGEIWHDSHRCLPSLVNGQPSLIRIET